MDFCSINGWTGSRGDSDPNTNNGVDYINQADALHVRENYFIKLSGLKDIMTANSGLIVSKTLSTTYKGGTGSSSHKIFLLGGLSGDSFYVSNYLGSNALRIGNASGFAHATSVFGSGSGSSASRATGWWLRSGDSSNAYYAYRVTLGGLVGGASVSPSDLGVRPSFILNLA